MGGGLVVRDDCVKREQGGPLLAGRRSRRRRAHTVQRIQQGYQVRGDHEEKAPVSWEFLLISGRVLSFPQCLA